MTPGNPSAQLAAIDQALRKQPGLASLHAEVRRPIYRSAIGRWLPYKDRIRPLLDALEIRS